MAATISFICPQCKAQLRGPVELEGRKARCKGCGATFVAKASTGAKPAAAAAAAPQGPRPQGSGPEPRPKTAMPAAGPAQTPAAKTVPAKTSAATPAPAPAPAAAAPASGDMAVPFGLAPEDDWVPPTKGPDKPAPAKQVSAPKYQEADAKPYDITELDLAPRCPYCTKEMESEDAIICLHCGYNTQTRSTPQIKRTYANTGSDQFLWLLPGIVAAVLVAVFLAVIVVLWVLVSGTSKSASGEDIPNTLVFAGKVWGSLISGVGMWIAGRFAIKRLIQNPTPPESEKR
jgi:hypothetical protein